MMQDYGELMWTCHICGANRPDAKISVQKNYRSMGGTRVQENVRYCNDKAECRKAAPKFSFLRPKGGAVSSRRTRPVGE